MKNAYIGYTYQQFLTSLLLKKMDVEREFDFIEIESADRNNDFDDVKIQSGNNEYHLQIKDFNDVSLNTLVQQERKIFINGKAHRLSNNINIICFRNIAIEPDSHVLGFPSYKLGSIYIVSLSRKEIEDRIRKLYELNPERESIINKFFGSCLDNRKLKIDRMDLPSIQIFDTKLIEPTIDVGRKHLEFENILVIEGKPGIGKSHLVNSLIKEYRSNIHYRFWISSQDKDYDQRLKFSNFIFDFSKKLFNDLLLRKADIIVKKLWELNKVVIIDGLDHVENYNSQELKKYIDFIGKLQTKCKTIILTRPLKYQLTWKTHVLVNWNETQTRKVLDELFHIRDYQTAGKIYLITNGYPILVRYLAEHYKQYNTIPDLSALTSIDEYYSVIFQENVRTKSALAIFLCCRSFYTKNEISLLLDEELAVIVNEFINGYSYLFELRLNRVSLLHDSFNTYLRKQNINYSARLTSVNQHVFNSIMNMEQRFLSRISFFDLDKKRKKEIAIKYCSISVFSTLVSVVIDTESIREFYTQIRELIAELSPDDLTVENYYEFSLILNIVNRDHISTLNEFLYTYVRTLLFNGYTEENITSSGYLFAMLHYVQTGNSDLLLNLTSNDFYSTDRFVEDLNEKIQEEEFFFDKHNSALSKSKIKKLLVKDTEQGFREKVTYVLENLFLHEKHQSDFKELTACIKNYVVSEDLESVYFLQEFLDQYDVRNYYAQWILTDARKNLLALGHIHQSNDYLRLSLKDFVSKYRDLGSFKLSVEILNYLRLSLHNNASMDVNSLTSFWTKYYNRKDYSLMSIPEALRVFERKKFVSVKQSISLITEIQRQSEKGYRGLLVEYIELHPIDIIDFLVKTFNFGELHIAWFTLPSKYINQFPDKLFEFAMKKLLQNHNSGEIDFDEVENVIRSNRRDEVRRIFELTEFKVWGKGVRQISFLKRNRIPVREFEDDKISNEQSSKERLAGGILTSKDRKMIVENNLKVIDVAGLGDGNYSTLADVNLFNEFPKASVRKSIKPILYHALTGKVSRHDSFHNVFYFPGNVPKLIEHYNVSVNYINLFEGFRRYLELSMFEIKLTKDSE